MPLSAFDDKDHPPSSQDLQARLGRAYAAWTTLLELVAEQMTPITEVWGFSGKNYGWGLRVRHKERVILYMTPQQNQFLVSFALGEKAVAAVGAARLPAAISDAIAAAPRYAEGRGVRIPVKNSRLLPALARLAAVKQRN